METLLYIGLLYLSRQMSFLAVRRHVFIVTTVISCLLLLQGDLLFINYNNRFNRLFRQRGQHTVYKQEINKRE